MGDIEQIQKVIDEINARTIKDYKKMDIKQISFELRSAMNFEQNTFKKIEELEKKGIKTELTKYVKMICRNTIEREISEIQDTYLNKIDKEYLKNSKIN